MMYKGVVITKMESSGRFYLKSPSNGTQRVFSSIEAAKRYIDRVGSENAFIGSVCGDTYGGRQTWKK